MTPTPAYSIFVTRPNLIVTRLQLWSLSFCHLPPFPLATHRVDRLSTWDLASSFPLHFVFIRRQLTMDSPSGPMRDLKRASKGLPLEAQTGKKPVTTKQEQGRSCDPKIPSHRSIGAKHPVRQWTQYNRTLIKRELDLREAIIEEATPAWFTQHMKALETEQRDMIEEVEGEGIKITPHQVMRIWRTPRNIPGVVKEIIWVERGKPSLQETSRKTRNRARGHRKNMLACLDVNVHNLAMWFAN